jgi:single-stranded-DNA-specific exonuclease
MSELDELISRLLINRKLETPEQISEFLNPPDPQTYSLAKVGIDPDSVNVAINLIKSHLNQDHPICIYGDYDVDGITGTAILWETLYQFSKSVFPHIPHRQEEGYGLSQKGIDHCLEKGAKLIITIDNGIVAHEQIAYCRSRNCDLIVIDHHAPDNSPTQANVLVHSVQTSAAGLAWFFCREFSVHNNLPATSSELLSLVAISVICDLVPLLGINRSFAKYGLEQLNQTTRPGLLALFESAGIGEKVNVINSYHVGFLIGPRLNAPGRLDYALDSLRLLCTRSHTQARELAKHLNEINALRQDKTLASGNHAISRFKPESLPKLLIVSSPDYDEGVIGLIAAKLVETYHRPAVAISIKDDFSKGSARSIPGFHITDFLRRFDKTLSAVGGHAMAAGFSIPTSRLSTFIKKSEILAEKSISEEILVKNTRIDAVVELSTMNYELFAKLKEFEPFGLGNPRPVFQSPSVPVSGFHRLGSDLRHLKFMAGQTEAIYFSAPAGVESAMETADLTYTLDLNIFNGKTTLQLVIKNISISHKL